MTLGSRSLLFPLLPITLLLAQSPQPKPESDAIPIPVDRGIAGLDRWLKALSTRASILMVTAHPDDEDGGLLAYETRGQGARGILLTLNRGEGGQNEMSSDLYDREGLVRTQELLQAGRYYGVEQYWTRAIDYGFSKTREEALDKWNHERVLGDVVRIIRMTRPLVITSVFVGAATDGHGNHQVAGEVAQEAYLAAGDPNRFPEQIKAGLQPWTPLKVYARVPFFAVTPKGMYDYAIDKYVPVRFFDYVNEKWSETRPNPNVEIPEGDYLPTAGLTYLQIGREGLNSQKSQNGGIALPPPAAFSSPYHRYGSRVPAADAEKSFFDGVDTSVEGIATLLPDPSAFLKEGLAEISSGVKKAIGNLQPDHPAGIAPTLSTALQRTQAVLKQIRASNLPEPGRSNVIFELEQKQMQFGKAIAAALGLSLQATVLSDRAAMSPFGPAPAETFAIAIPGQSFSVQAQFFNAGPEAVEVTSAAVTNSDGKAWTITAKPAGAIKPQAASGRFANVTPIVVSAAPAAVASCKDAKFQFAVTAPSDAVLTRPYFSRDNEEQPYYNIDDPRYENQSSAPYPLAATLQVTYRGATFPLSQDVQAFQRTSGIGLLPNPLLVGPAISVTVAPSAGAVPLGTKSFSFSATVHSNVKGPANGTLQLNLPNGWTAIPASAPFSMARDGEDNTIAFTVNPGSFQAGDFKITAVATYQGKQYEEGYRMVGYAGLRPSPFYRPAVYHAVGMDVKAASGLRVAYLPGTGDEVPQALENLGVSVRILNAADVTFGDLSGYDAIVLGTRAYAVRPELKSANNRLLEYVKDGGVLIVQYNLQGFDRDYGPYPFSLGDNPQKVVDEGNKVDILQPSNPIFNWPNKITSADFSGWVEERGHGFMSTWDKQYTPLLETQDPEQDPQLGGLLLAHYGKGSYIYDAFALYRQLPVGVPGAYRILANLVSLKKNPL